VLVSKPYDDSDPKSIEAYACRLIGKTLRDAINDLPESLVVGGKGKFGNILERYYFGYMPNSRPEPDFPKAGVELKSTPLKRQGKRLVAKERLVLGNIDFMTLDTETWEKSSLLKKSRLLLLVFYLHEDDKGPLDREIKIVRLWEFPEEDLAIIKSDWERIAAKVREGRANELSEGDTLYLGACTKAADSSVLKKQKNSSILAKPRAFSLKQSYMNAVINESLKLQSVAGAVEATKQGVHFEQLVHARFRPYVGKTADEIADELGVKIQRGAKNFYAVLTKRILGVDPERRIAEFEKANVHVSTVRLKPNGVPKEDLPFRAFDYCDLVQQHWESSDLRNELQRRFFFVIYQLDREEVPTLTETRFWSMPVSDIEGPARECFDETIHRIEEDRADYLPKKSENVVCHVRPHGRDSRDVVPTPSGKLSCRKSFWLNGSYIKRQLDS